MASLEQYLNVPPRAYRGSGRRTKAALVLILLAWVGGFLVHSRGPGTPRINFIPGDPEASRGPVSLAVVARWCHAQPTIERINQLARVGDSGTTSLLDLREAATSLGLSSRVVRLDPSRGFPWRLPMILYLHENHFVSALPIDETRAVLVDPPGTPRVWDSRELANDWSGLALVVASTPEEATSALARAGFLKR